MTDKKNEIAELKAAYKEMQKIIDELQSLEKRMIPLRDSEVTTDVASVIYLNFEELLNVEVGNDWKQLREDLKIEFESHLEHLEAELEEEQEEEEEGEGFDDLLSRM